ncbi:Radical SAM domain protein [Candidatus Magnetomorum sp. HK-1]|nr:Radical SAM domain protein [Candidatus Magnetomorum sp. HK-1]
MIEKNKLLFEYNNKVRIKITDRCNLSCPFCHSEGTIKSETISIDNSNTKKWLKEFKSFFKKVHLTGGEPTLYKNLPVLCNFLKKEGYDISLTTNLMLLNDNLFNSLQYISVINISVHTFNQIYFSKFVKKGTDLSKINLNRLTENILELKKRNQVITINTVVSDDIDQELEDVLQFCIINDIPLKLVPDWRYLNQAKNCILSFLNNHGFFEKEKRLKIPGSNLRVLFNNNDGFCVEFKDILPYYLDFWCDNCHMKDRCIEKFSFLRLEGNPLRFKICIDKPSLDNDKFEKIFWTKFRNEMQQIYEQHFSY